MSLSPAKPVARRRRALLLIAAAPCCVVLAVIFWPREVILPALPTHDDPAVAAALAAAKQQVLEQPRSADAWGRMGMTLFANGDPAAAAPFLAEAERLDPVDQRWPFLQAIILLQGQPAAALQKARRARELAPDYVNIHVVAGEIAFQQGLMAEAEEAFQHALRCDADNPYALLGMARWHADRNDLDETRKLLGGIKNHPAVAKAAVVLLAEVLDRSSQSDAAREHLRRVQRLPDDPPRRDRILDEVQSCMAGLQAQSQRTERLQKQGALNEAVENQRQAVETYPKNVAAHLLLGKVYVQRAQAQLDAAARQRDLTAARNAFQTALQLDPDNMRVKFYLGLAFFEQRAKPGSLAQAIAHFRDVLARQPDDSLAAEYLADCLMMKGAWQEAANVYRKLIQIRPDLPDAHAALAEALEHQRDLAGALLSWLNACQLAPTNPRNQTRLLLAARRLFF